MKGGFLMARGAWMRANRLAANPHETVIWRDHDQRKNRELRRETGWLVGRYVATVAERGTRNRPRTPQTRGERPKEKDLNKSGLNVGADYRIRTDDLPLTRRLLYQLS